MRWALQILEADRGSNSAGKSKHHLDLQARGHPNTIVNVLCFKLWHLPGSAFEESQYEPIQVNAIGREFKVWAWYPSAPAGWRSKEYSRPGTRP